MRTASSPLALVALILEAAVKAADLVQTLKGKSPVTVSAPANSAFAALPVGTIDNLPKADSKATLTKVLTYDVVAGKRARCQGDEE